MVTARILSMTFVCVTFVSCAGAKFSGASGKSLDASPQTPAQVVPSSEATPAEPVGTSSISGTVKTAPVETSSVPISDSFKDNYSVANLGPPPGVPTPFGCITSLPGQPDALLVGGNANSAKGAFYSIKIKRDADGHVAGYDGQAELFMEAPFNDGGCIFLDQKRMLMTRWPTHSLALVDTSTRTLLDQLDLHGLISVQGFPSNESVAALALVPGEFGNAGRLMLTSWPSSRVFQATLSAGSAIQLTNVKEFTALSSFGPEGFVYVPKNSPGVKGSAVIVSEYTGGAVALYATDAEGAPILASRQVILNLNHAEGAFLEAATGDYFFSTFNGDNGDSLFALRGLSPATPAPVKFSGVAFVDEDDNGQLGEEETQAQVQADGAFKLDGIPPGTHKVRLSVTTPYQVSLPDEGAIIVELEAGVDAAGLIFTVSRVD